MERKAWKNMDTHCFLLGQVKSRVSKFLTCLLTLLKPGFDVFFISLALLFSFPALVSAQAASTEQSNVQTNCIDGMAGEYSCKNVDLLSHLSLQDLGDIGSAQDNWGWKDS